MPRYWKKRKYNGSNSVDSGKRRFSAWKFDKYLSSEKSSLFSSYKTANQLYGLPIVSYNQLDCYEQAVISGESSGTTKLHFTFSTNSLNQQFTIHSGGSSTNSGTASLPIGWDVLGPLYSKYNVIYTKISFRLRFKDRVDSDDIADAHHPDSAIVYWAEPRDPDTSPATNVFQHTQKEARELKYQVGKISIHNKGSQGYGYGPWLHYKIDSKKWANSDNTHANTEEQLTGTISSGIPAQPAQIAKLDVFIGKETNFNSVPAFIGSNTLLGLGLGESLVLETKVKYMVALWDLVGA
jgi:hypothetical protein